jgi:uncharacterized protein (DUF2062 family)
MFANWKHKLPTREKIFASRWFKPFAHLFDKPEYWAFKRDKVALSVAIGLFCGMLPAPTQFFSALMMAYLLRTQLPIALFSTLYTNPLTLIPLYVAAYKLGSRLLYGTAAQAELVMPALGEPGFWADAGRWTLQFGQPLDAPIRPAAGPLAFGILIMGTTFALAGYALVQIIWRWRINRKQARRKRRQRRKESRNV